MKKEVIYDEALNHYGLFAQIDMVFEEFAELQKELCKLKRGKRNFPEIAEELADCFIMLEQMEQFFNLKKVVTDIKCRKLRRLEERLIKGDEASEDSDSVIGNADEHYL